MVDEPAHANRLYNRGYLGDPQPGNALRLSLVEAAWAMSQGRLDVAGADIAAGPLGFLASLARKNGGRDDGEIHTAFLAYADLRERGLIVRHTDGGLAAWPRGKGIEGAPAYVVRPASRDDRPTAGELLGWAQAAVVVAVVDGDGIITYFRLSLDGPAGQCNSSEVPRVEGTPVQSGVVAADAAAIKRLHEGLFLGTPAPGGLLLSDLEANWLLSRGALEMGRDRPGVTPQTACLSAVYDALRAAGVVPRSGFKFGTDLRGYESDPENSHATWLIDSAASDDSLAWDRLAMAVRMAHGVRKRFLLAVVAEKRVHFVGLSWFKP